MKSKYIHEFKVHNTKAAEIVIPYILDLIKPQSVVDIGCGIGTWLKIFQENGITNILGIDGSHTDQSKLMISKDFFQTYDLEKLIQTDKKFDLAISLEVAEHLSSTSAEKFVNTLTNFSDIILFSAAITKQGGQNHINEQLPSYWEKKFNEKNYTFYDIIRWKFWNNKDVDLWYRQNMFLVVNNDIANKLNLMRHINNIDIVHPDLYLSKLNQIETGQMGLIFPFKILMKTVQRGFQRLFRN